MAISKKLEKVKTETKEKELDIDRLIEKGGSAPKSVKKNKEELRTTLILPLEIVEQIDEARDKKIGHVNRNSWILQAIMEKLKRKK